MIKPSSLIVPLLFFHCGGDSVATDADAAEDCRLDVRAQAYAEGMAASASDGVKVILRSAEPAPPVRFGNRWSVQVLDSQGQPMAGAELTVDPFMPDHGHGTPLPPKVVAGVEDGTFELGPFDLWMPGIWEMRFAASLGAETSLAILTICVQE